MYTGYKSLKLSEDDLAKLYQGKFEPLESFFENEYLILKGESGPLDYFRFSNGKFERVAFPVLGEIKPRNPQQYCAWDLIKNEQIPLKLITGKFGTGKSLACIAGALEAVQKDKFEKIVFVRNNVQVKDTDSLGALPGDAYEKTLPYVLPFADHCGGVEGLRYLIEHDQLEVIPLGFLRGRSIRNSIIYSMESENLTKEQIQLLIGRVDEGSQLWMDGDLKQRDKTAFEKSQGLETLIERLKGNKLFGYIELEKSERSEVAALADLLD